MKFLSHLKDTVKMGDFFNSYQMLRYQEQTQYRTFTGGLISIGIIITITIAFANMIIDTMNRTIINFTENSMRQADPSLVSIKASAESKFMFGVEVWGHNLSSQYRYFDVVFEQIQSNFGQNYTKTIYSLQPCTKQHWKMLPTVEDDYEKLRMGNWLCPTIGTLILLQGKYSSQFYHQYSVTLYPCNNATDPSRPCAPRQQAQAFIASNGQFNYFTYYYINSIVNPQEPQYVQYYLEDRQWIIFGSELGAESDMYLTQIHIASDNSIWPFPEYKQQKVYYIDFSPRYYPLSVSNQSCYATFYVMKDPMLHTYNRQVQKIFVVFSFMGGLIGAVMACLFFINIYTSFAYEIALARKIFKDKESMTAHQLLKNEAKGSVNILHFLKYCLYQLATKFGIEVDWPFIEYLEQCRKEILRQLDIRDLIKRLIFLEYSISYILEDYHLAEMQREMTYHPEDVQNLRKKFQSGIDESEQGSEQSSPSTHKEMIQSNHAMFEKIQAESTNQQITSTKRNTNAVAPLDNIHDDKIFVENIDFASLPKLSCKINQNKRLVNIRRLTQSAKEGNIISKKLLDVITSKQIEKQQRKSKQIDLSKLNLTLIRKS